MKFKDNNGVTTGAASPNITRAHPDETSGGCLPHKEGEKRIASIMVFPLSMEMYVGEAECVYESTYPTIATNCQVKWSSSDDSIASVHPVSGLVSAHKPGVVKIYATAQDGGGVSSYCVVGVHDFITVESIRLYDRPLKLRAGERCGLFANVFPIDATNRKVLWSSSNKDIAKVDPHTGIITAKRAGIATINAVSTDGGAVSAGCTVRVKRLKRKLRARYWKPRYQCVQRL